MKSLVKAALCLGAFVGSAALANDCKAPVTDFEAKAKACADKDCVTKAHNDAATKHAACKVDLDKASETAMKKFAAKK